MQVSDTMKTKLLPSSLSSLGGKGDSGRDSLWKSGMGPEARWGGRVGTAQVSLISLDRTTLLVDTSPFSHFYLPLHFLFPILM